MELRHLRYFVAVAEERHFGRAAARLFIAQSSLSQQIKALERELGVVLFERGPRRVELTEAGRTLLATAPAALADIDAAVTATRLTGRSVGDRITVGFYCTLTTALIPPVLRLLQDTRPGLTVEVEHLDGTDTTPVARGAVHAALLRPPYNTTDVTGEPLLAEPVAVAVPTDHALAGEHAVDLDALATGRWVYLSAPGAAGTLARFRGKCGEAGFEPDIVHWAPTVPTVLSLVAAGIGLFPVPYSARTSSPEGVTLVPVRGWTSQIDLVTGTSPPPAVRIFGDAVRRVAATLHGRDHLELVTARA